jgi:4-hydroxybutyrate CoA-transferase
LAARAHRTVTGSEAAQIVKAHDRVVLANFCGEPHILPGLIMDRAPELNDVSIFHLRPSGRFVERYLEPGMENHVRCATAFAGGIKPIVQLLKERRADFYPIPLSKVPWLFRSASFGPNVFITTVTPPDEKGYCSLGVSVDYAHAALETAGTVIAEVNENMPRTGGDSLVHVSKIDYMVEANETVYEIPTPTVTKLEKQLAENVAELVDDGATIQIGYGAVSESIPPFLKEKRNLGMHTEMFPESAITLVEEGALTNEKKSLDKGRTVCAFTAGTKRLYDWLNNNPKIAMKPFDYTNDAGIIAGSSKMTAINTALQLDLFGNVYSDVLGFDEYSGAGGQPDFAIGAQFCPDGKSIIVLPSTTSDGKLSRIVGHPTVTANKRSPAIPTLARFHADYVVTEWGTAALRGKSIKERARKLLDISHPDFNRDLVAEGSRLGLLS